jgi:predicted ATP-dependent endonuclease of OLD family
MKINRVWAKNLHGNLTFDISLHSGINLLVGVNGSGKTSILNIIKWITSADVAMLSITEFREVGIEITLSTRRKATISVTQNELDLNINCTVGQTVFHPISVSLRTLPRELRDRKTRKEELREHYTNLGPEKMEVKLWTFLQAFDQPLTISLDQKITVHGDDVTLVDDETGRMINKRISRAPIDPMVHVGIIARQRHSQYQSQLIKLNDTLKAKVIASTFSTSSENSRAKSPTLSKINAVEHKLLTRMSAWTTDTKEHDAVTSYFARIKKIIQNIEKAESKHISAVLSRFLSDDMYRISALSDAFDEFESKAASAFEPIQNYLKILNSFFIDIKKTLLFSEQNSQLYYQVNNESKDLRNVDVMSSGERQILILLTYIASPPQATNIFVIDEPELSLHPKWQHQLLPSIDELMGADSQMIIATHSPEIVGKYKSKCIEL